MLSEGISDGGPRCRGLWTPKGQVLNVEGRGLQGNGSQGSQAEGGQGVPGREPRLSTGLKARDTDWQRSWGWRPSQPPVQSPPTSDLRARSTGAGKRLTFPSIPRGLDAQISCVWAAHGLWQPGASGKRGGGEGGLGRFTDRQGGHWAGALSRWVPQEQAGAWIPGGGPGSHPDPRRQETGLVSQRFPSG